MPSFNHQGDAKAQEGDSSYRQINFFGRFSQGRARAQERKLSEIGHASPGCGMHHADNIPPPRYTSAWMCMVKGTSSFFIKRAFGIPSVERYDAIENFIRVFHVRERERGGGMEGMEGETVKKKAQPVRAAYRCGILNSWDKHESPVRQRRYAARYVYRN